MIEETNFTQEYEIHELCKLFPPMSEDQFTALMRDIAENGLRQPIVIYENKILDGRHRYKACINLGRQPVSVIYDGDDPLGFVISHNLSRRHLDESQRAMIATRCATLKRGGKNDLNVEISTLKLSQKDAAARFNIGRHSVIAARKVVEKGTQELSDAVESGQIAVTVAAKIAQLDHEQQAQVIADPKPEQAIKKIARREKEQALAERTRNFHIWKRSACQNRRRSGRLAAPAQKPVKLHFIT